MVKGNFSYLCSLDYWKMHLQIKKLNLDIFTHAISRKSLSQALIINPPQAEGSYSHSWQSVPNPLFYEDPPLYCLAPLFKFCPTLSPPPPSPAFFVALFLWLTVSSRHIYCCIILLVLVI